MLTLRSYQDEILERARCSVEGCDRSVHCKALCSLHYKRLWLHGDPLGRKTRVRKDRICSVPECGGEHDSFGYCGRHAQRLRRYGDINYLTPEQERVKRLREAQPTLGKAKPTTYPKLFGRHEHRRVAEEKLGRPLAKGEIVHHIDGDKHNNHPDNLQVMTQSEHMKEHRAELLAGKRAKQC